MAKGTLILLLLAAISTNNAQTTTTHNSPLQVVNIDGAWSPWSTRLSNCVSSPSDQLTLVTCGVGMKKRFRSCTNPTPQGGGMNCSGKAEEWSPCNTQLCQLPIAFLWSAWGPCSANCGVGLRTRYTLCGTIRERMPGAVKLVQDYVKNHPNGTTAGNGTTTTKTSNTTTNISTTTAAITTTTTTTTTTTSTSTTTKVNTTTTLNATTTVNSTTTTTITTTPKSTTVIALNPNWIDESLLPAYQVGYDEDCNDNQYVEQKEVCNTWDQTLCPDPCSTPKCPFSAKCINRSNSTNALYICACQLGLIMKADGSACIQSPPPSTTPRPIPSLAPPVKAAANVLTRGASFVLIGFLVATIILFAILGIWKETSRVIHLNMEIALLCAHICVLPPGLYNSDPALCRVVSIGLHFFFTACFFFMLLEAIHLYSLVGWVVRKGGLLNGFQNIGAGWGGAFVVVMICMSFIYKDYGGSYHCWLQMDTSLVYGQLVPIGIMTIMTLTILEAAGSAADYEPLEGVDEIQRTTAKVMHRTLVIILPLVFTSFILGVLGDYNQDMALYSIFTIINGVLGGLIFFFHCSANERVRAKVVNGFKKLCGKKSMDEPQPLEG